MAREIQVPEARFACQSCGRCCNLLTVTVDAARVEQLRKHDWGGPDPFRRRRGEGDPFSIRKAEGRCFFLGEANRCRIHEKIGYDAKPEACKAFPLFATAVAGTTHARLSFFCPAVVANKGKRMHEQMRWIRATVKAAGDMERKAPLKLDDCLEITLRDLEMIEQALVDLISNRDHPVADRVAAGAALLARLSKATAVKGKSALVPALKAAKSTGISALSEEGRQGGSSARAGPIFSLFLGQDCRPSKLARFGHFFGVRLFNVGLSRLRSELMKARASWRAVRHVTLDMPEHADELLTRYLIHKLRSRRILAGDHTLVSGFNLLAAAYGVIDLLARVRAAHQGLEATIEEDIRMAVQAADPLVMEHSAIYLESMLTGVIEAVLAREDLCASILARLGGR